MDLERRRQAGFDSMRTLPKHPEMVLGRNALTGSQYSGEEYTVEPTGKLDEQLAEAVERSAPEHERQEVCEPRN